VKEREEASELSEDEGEGENEEEGEGSGNRDQLRFKSIYWRDKTPMRQQHHK
jgi:hypothetical protein